MPYDVAGVVQGDGDNSCVLLSIAKMEGKCKDTRIKLRGGALTVNSSKNLGPPAFPFFSVPKKDKNIY